jgi:putative transposase
MNQTERLNMVVQPHEHFSIVEQCALLKLPRSTYYCKPAPISDDDLTLMKKIDVIYTKWPTYGSRRMVAELRGDGYDVNRKHIQRLMQLMGIEAIYQKPNTSLGHPAHKKYPYLLKNVVIDRPDQVWCADITYIPMKRGFVYLVAVMDWFSRRILSWRMSITMETDFCVAALREAMELYGKPEIFNTDQGIQFTAAAFIEQLESEGIQISMDGKGRFLDNIFIERFWRSLKYEEVYLRAYETVVEARSSLGTWITVYNDERKHQTHGYRTPSDVFFARARPVDMRTMQERASQTFQQDMQQSTERACHNQEKVAVSDSTLLAA